LLCGDYNYIQAAENSFFYNISDMNLVLGTLCFVPAIKHPELVAAPVASALSLILTADTVGVSEIDPTLSDTVAFCERYKIGPKRAANCVVLQAKRGEKRWFAGCVVLATTRADVNGIARHTLDARKVSFAPMEEAVSLSHMEYGAITPIGLPEDWPILIDKVVAHSGYIIVGSGVRKSKLAVEGKLLAQLPNAQVIEGLGQIKSNV
jgi:prolyl-tRNA editing enzyme YbaK/EbsC (Cys-tRNA(Pro) deacylase)